MKLILKIIGVIFCVTSLSAQELSDTNYQYIYQEIIDDLLLNQYGSWHEKDKKIEARDYYISISTAYEKWPNTFRDSLFNRLKIADSIQVFRDTNYPLFESLNTQVGIKFSQYKTALEMASMKDDNCLFTLAISNISYCRGKYFIFGFFMITQKELRGLFKSFAYEFELDNHHFIRFKNFYEQLGYSYKKGGSTYLMLTREL